MKALVLAGGLGTRLRPFSYSVPKQLVPVANRPVLFHVLKMLRDIGVEETGIVVSGDGTPIRTAVGDGSRFGMSVTYLPQDEPRGLAHCVMIAREFLADDDFVMYLGDNIFAGGIGEQLADFQRDRPTAQLVVSKVADPSQYGVVEIDDTGRVTALQEKPARPRSDLAVTGAYFFTPAIHEAVEGIEPSWRNELEITDAVQWLVTRGHEVRARLFPGYWADTGTLADLLECNKVLLEGVTTDIQGSTDSLTLVSGPVVIEPGARVEASVIVGPVVIGAGSSVADSYIGPFTTLGSGCRLLDAAVEYSILMDRASVSGVRTIQGSIIGTAGQVSQGRQEPAVHRLMVGDDSCVEVPA